MRQGRCIGFKLAGPNIAVLESDQDFKGLQEWRAIARSPIVQLWLVFGGDGEYLRREVQMMGWREMVGRLKDEGNREI